MAPKMLNDNQTSNSNPMNVSNEQYWEVQALLGQKYMRGIKHHLVKWVGYAPQHNTWQPQYNIVNLDYLKHSQHQQHLPTTQLPKSIHQETLNSRKGKGKKTISILKNYMIKNHQSEEFDEQSRLSELDTGKKQFNKNKNIKKLGRRSLKLNLRSNFKTHQLRNLNPKNYLNIDNKKLINSQEISRKSGTQKKYIHKPDQVIQEKSFYQPYITEQYERIVLSSKANQEQQYNIDDQMSNYVNKQIGFEQLDSNIPQQIIQRVIGTNDYSKKTYEVQLFNGQIALIHQDYLKKYFSKTFCQYFLNKENEDNYS